MKFNDFQLLVPTPHSPLEPKVFRFSDRDDLEVLLESFKKSYPQFRDAIHTGEPMHIADVLNGIYLETQQDISPIPFEFTSRYDTQMNKRLPGHRFYAGVPMNACISNDYWNCLLPTGVYALVLEKLDIGFKMFTPFYGSHPAILLEESSVFVSFRYEQIPTPSRNAVLEIIEPGKLWESYISKMQDTSMFGRFDGIYSLTLPEFTLATRFNLFAADPDNIGRMRENLSMIETTISRNRLNIATGYLADKMKNMVSGY
ncbi:MAG: hypothetical protein NDI94_02070 [Candidatus Woesearchaeota archaeon]|nr:hypothetical protein [Candidatus Woesearchaeota archaeon]